MPPRKISEAKTAVDKTEAADMTAQGTPVKAKVGRKTVGKAKAGEPSSDVSLPIDEMAAPEVPEGAEADPAAGTEEIASSDGAGGAAPPAATDPERKWYVVHTYSGYEGKVKANLEKRVESMLMQDKIFRIVVPTEDEIEYKDGRKLITKKKIFPGYVLVEMVMNDDSWYVVRNTPGVTGFVGSGAKPVSLDASEVKGILRHMGVDEPRPKVMYEDGESVKVVHGPFMGFIGKVREVNLDKGKLRVLVSMFGRETPVELDFSQVEKL
jgi:transcriptional antiterminator NusG